MTDFEYRTLPAYANSDLSELFNLRMGKPARGIDEKAARFGTTFHQMILEPEKEIDWSKHHVKEHALLLEMKASFWQNTNYLEVYHRMIKEGQNETVWQWECPQTGLPLKAKIDNCFTPVIGYPTIIDIKTTSCKNSQDFFNKMLEYGYDRQAAFYMDAVGIAYNFIFVAVQKCKPFDVFTIHMAQSDDRQKMIDNARKKNERLLRDALAESQKENGWRPSSWSRKVTI